jgi:hypothetical protein
MTLPTPGVTTSWGTQLNDHIKALVVNVRNHGAVGDGIADDTTAIQAALNAAAAGTAFGSVVAWLPYTSTGYLASAVNVPAGVTLRGERLVTIKKTGASSAHLVATTGHDSTIEGLTLDPNGLATTRILNINGHARIRVRDCQFVDSGATANLAGIETRAGTEDILIERNVFDGVNTGIHVNQGPARVTIRGNRIRNWKQRGIYVVGDATNSAVDLTIEGNHISALVTGAPAPRHPIQIVGDDTNRHRRVRVNYNTVLGPGKSWTATDPGTADQISVHRCQDFEVIGNISRDGGDMGITVSQQCERGIIANNVCLSNDVGGIIIGSSASSYTRYITVTGNVCMNNGQNRNADRGDNRMGVWAYAASHCRITGNIIGDNQGTATQLYGVTLHNCTNVAASPNTFQGNATAPYNVATGNTDYDVTQTLRATKTADTTRNNTATRTADPHLTLANVPIGTYRMRAFIVYRAESTADLSVSWTRPGGTTMSWTTNAPASTTTSVNTVISRIGLNAASSLTIGGVSGNDVVALFEGVVTITAAGTVTLDWAQGVAEVSDAILRSGSSLELVRVA